MNLECFSCLGSPQLPHLLVLALVNQKMTWAVVNLLQKHKKTCCFRSCRTIEHKSVLMHNSFFLPVSVPILDYPYYSTIRTLFVVPFVGHIITPLSWDSQRSSNIWSGIVNWAVKKVIYFANELFAHRMVIYSWILALHIDNIFKTEWLFLHQQSECGSLWCWTGGAVCHSSIAPPMDGTKCGERHVSTQRICFKIE